MPCDATPFTKFRTPGAADFLIFARQLKAEMRKSPSSAEPKPEPGVMTIRALPSILPNEYVLRGQSGGYPATVD